MTEAVNGQRTGANLFAWPISVVTDINGKLLESAADAQKEWAEFVGRRLKEDMAASQRLMNCQSFADMQQIYSQYWRTALEQYREQSERVVQRGTTMTERA